jgi:2-oxoglutarate/2-oxoacid ferredoxin oxidoreductase subunit beta
MTDEARVSSIVKDLSGFTPTWCPGCGNFGIVRAIRLALAQMSLTPDKVFIAFDIGCSGNMNDFLNANSMHTLHGRAIASAIGMKLANHHTPTIVIGGDGGIYGEGGNHFLHACRGNHDITILVHDNMVYGLTTGQVAPTANKGYRSRSTPTGIIEQPVNALALAITQGATFVAQTFTNDSKQMVDLISRAVSHKGLSVINILQPCVTFNKINTYQYFMEKSYKIDQSTHDPGSVEKALALALESSAERFPLGLLYQITDSVPYHEEILQLANDETLSFTAGKTHDVLSIINSFL